MSPRQTTLITILNRKAWRAKDLLELIHTNVCGPMRRPSHHNNRYFILFIDDFSRMTLVYFLKTKLEVFRIFKKFKDLIKKQSGKRIKVLVIVVKSTHLTSLTNSAKMKA